MTAIEITKDNFQSEVLDSELPVLLDLWAAWCGPCRLVAPVVEEIAAEYAGRLKVGKIDVDDQPELQETFQALSIPTLVLVKDGKVVAKAVGARPKAALAAALEPEEHAPAVAAWPAATPFRTRSGSRPARVRSVCTPVASVACADAD